MNLEKTGLFLKEKRTEKEIDLKEIAQRFNVSESIVNDWENGISLPNAKEIPLYCTMLGITVEELYSGKSLNKVMSKQKGDMLVMFSSVMILAGVLSFFLLRSIELEVSILSAFTFSVIGILTLLYVGLKKE